MTHSAFSNKAIAAALQVLQGIEQLELQKILSSQTICLAFDESATASPEGKKSLDLATRLLARLYPNLSFYDLDQKNTLVRAHLEELAQSINPEICIVDSDKATMFLVVGNTAVKEEIPAFYIGSTGWVAKLSNEKPVGSDNTSNPFGAGGAACIGAANIFRFVFQKHLPHGPCDTEVELSLLTHTKPNVTEPPFENVRLEEYHLVGAGAVGNGALWALCNIPDLTGILHVIDKEEIEASNLQRYVMTLHSDIGKYKVDHTKGLFTSALSVHTHQKHWDAYVYENQNWQIRRVAIAVDSARDRIRIQSSLPKTIINAWTQPDDLGISRHMNFLTDPCVACLYLPEKETRSQSQIIADNLRISMHERKIRPLVDTNASVDRILLQLISDESGVPMDKLEPFEGMSMNSFYSEAACGRMLFHSEAKPNSDMDVPLAFQSAFAGLLLAAEMVIEVNGFRQVPMPFLSRFNLLRPISYYHTEGGTKHPSGRCICQDPDFGDAYRSKWNL